MCPSLTAGGAGSATLQRASGAPPAARGAGALRFGECLGLAASAFDTAAERLVMLVK